MFWFINYINVRNGCLNRALCWIDGAGKRVTCWELEVWQLFGGGTRRFWNWIPLLNYMFILFYTLLFIWENDLHILSSCQDIRFKL